MSELRDLTVFQLVVIGAYFGFSLGCVLTFLVAGFARRTVDRLFDRLFPSASSRTPGDLA